MEAALLPGDYSTIGRNTSLGLTNLRKFCNLDYASGSNEVKTPRPQSPNMSLSISAPLLAMLASTQGGPNSPNGKSPLAKWPKGYIKDMAAGMVMQSGFGDGLAGSPKASAIAGRPTVSGIAPLVRAYGNGRGAEEGNSRVRPDSLDAECIEEQGSVRGKASPCFTSLGQDTSVFCDRARVLSGRFCFPVKLAETPDYNRYKPQHKSVKERIPSWDIGERPKHQTKKLQDSYNDLDPFRSIDLSSTNISCFSTLSKKQSKDQMSLTTARNDMCNISSASRTWRDPILMHESPEYATEWHLQDTSSSRKERQPNWDFDKHCRGRKNGVKHTYFEAGKFEPQSNTMPKNGVDFSRSISRRAASCGQLGHLAPQAMLKSNSSSTRANSSRNTENVQADRSMFRACPQTRPRVLNVQDFSKGLARSSVERSVHYDTDDPAASAATLQQELSFDADSADHVVIPRRDHAPSMARSLDRNRAGHGARLFQEDHAVRTMHGLFTTKQGEGTIENSEEVPSDARPVRGICFEQYKGRAPSRINGKFSPLKKPRDMAAPDFSRKEPLPGFETSCKINTPALGQRSRAHEPLPNWTSTSSRSSSNNSSV